jgi:hypothetical protein
MLSVKDFVEQYKVLPVSLIKSEKRQKYISDLEIKEMAFKGDHLKIYQDKIEEEIYIENYKTKNVIQPAINIKRNLMIKDGFDIYALKNLDFFNNFIKKYKIKNIRASNVNNILKLGNAFLYLDLDWKKDRKDQYEIIPRVAHPSNVWYIQNGNYAHNVDFVFIDHERKVKVNDKEEVYLTLVIHSKVDFVTLEYKLDGENYLLLDEEDPFEKSYYEHPYLEEFLVFNFKNEETIEFIAQPEITDSVLYKQHFLNISETTKYIVLYRVAYPTKFLNTKALNNFAGVATELQADGTRKFKTKREHFVDGGKKEDFYLETEEVTGYLKEVSDEADKQLDDLCNSLNINPGLYRALSETGVTSGKGLEILYWKTVSDATYKQSIEKEEWIRFFNAIQTIAHFENGEIEELDDIDMEFHLTLFKDKEQELKEEGMKIDNYQKKKDLGLIISNETMTKIIEGLTDEEIAFEKEKKMQEEMEDLPQINRGTPTVEEEEPVEEDIVEGDSLEE